MKRLIPLGLAFAMLVAACGGSAGQDVATLGGDDGDPAATADAAGEADAEEAILAFSACMRENGIEDFEDPGISEDGGITFGGPGPGAGQELSKADREEMLQAFQACSVHLEGVGIGPGAPIDTSQIEDQLYEFAACMRENGYDMPDPDLSAIGPPDDGADPGEFGGPFGDIDPDDPAFREAMEACGDVFGGGFVIGGGPGGGPGGAVDGGGTNTENG